MYLTCHLQDVLVLFPIHAFFSTLCVLPAEHLDESMALVDLYVDSLYLTEASEDLF